MSFFTYRLATLAALGLFLKGALSRNVSGVPLPECGSYCWEAVCSSTTNADCICSVDGYNKIYECIAATCTEVTDFYIAWRKAEDVCHVPRHVFTVDPDYLGTAITVFAVEAVFFALRIVARMLGLGKWGWDDTTCVAAFVTLIGQLVMCILEDHWGYYRNYWTLDFDNIPPYLKADFARTVVYAVGLGLCKASIICLYQRIFEGPRLRWMLLLSQIFNAILSLSFVISAFFVAQPFSAQFEVDRPANYVYHDVWDGTGAFSTVNAAWDIWLIAIPAVVVCQLRMKTERKLNVIGVSATGIITCVFAILRFVIYRLEAQPTNDDDYYQILIWLVFPAYYAELCSCFVIACLPAVRQLVGKKLWPVLKTRIASINLSWPGRGSFRAVSYGSVSSRRAPERSERRLKDLKRASWVNLSSLEGSVGTPSRHGISSPLQGSFVHLGGYLSPVSPKQARGTAYAV